MDIRNVILLIALIIVISYLIYDSYTRRPRRSIYIVRELLECTRCKLTIERESEPGDFIGLIKGKCPSCNGDMKIKGIYAIEKKSSKL